MNTFIILFRECLEASLIIGIIYTYLNGLGAVDAKKYVWRGLIAAILASIGFGILIHYMGQMLQNEAYEKLYEAVMMYLAAGFLLYMVVWMAKNTRIATQLKQSAGQALENNPAAIFGVVFFAVAREGVETALFLFASKEMSGGGIGNWIGALLGIILAVGIGYAIFAQGKKIPLKTFFHISSILLILLAGGMVAYGTHEGEEFLVKTKVLDEQKIARVWDVLKPSKELPDGANRAFYTFSEEKGKYFHVLHDKGKIGVFIKAFFGYNSDPNWIEFILWLTTIGGGFYMWDKAKRNPIKT